MVSAAVHHYRSSRGDYAYDGKEGSPEDLELLSRSGTISFDVEGSGVNLGTSFPYGFSVACDTNGAYYADVENPYFRGVLADERRIKIAHHASYDRSMMKIAGLELNNLCCTMIAAHLLGEIKLSLKSLALKYLDLNVVSYPELDKSFGDMTFQEMLEYSGPHSIAALMLWEAEEPLLKKFSLLDVFWNIEMPLVPVLSDMELNGVMVDVDVLEALGREFDEKLSILTSALDYWSGRPGMNHNSPDQVADLLYDKFGLPADRQTKSGKRPSVDKRYIEGLKSKCPYVGVYDAFKELKTLKHSYVDSLIKQVVGGRVYGSFNQTRTRTGRLSSSDPNLQKIPQRRPEGKKIRTAIVAPPGDVLLKADYDLLELKMMGHCSQDAALLEAFRAGRDIHTETAIRVYGDADRRGEGKTLDFKIIYGGGEAWERQMFFDAYPGVLEWTKRTVRDAIDAGYVRTLGGRIRVIPGLDPAFSPRVKDHAGKEAISTIVQGSSAEVVKIGMVNAWKELRRSDARMILQVHDELVFEVPANRVQEVAEVLQRTLQYDRLSIPLTVSIEVGPNWGQMEKYKGGEYVGNRG